MVYDPVKAHDYYIRTRDLKGRHNGPDKQPTRRDRSNRPIPAPVRRTPSAETTSSAAKVARLQDKVASLKAALSEALQALSEKRQAEAKAKKESSDGKTTAKQRADSKAYRDSHKAELAAKRKAKDAAGSGGGSSSSTSTSTSTSSSSSSSSSSQSVSSMSVAELEARVSRIQTALSDAQRQLSDAMGATGRLAHTDFISSDLMLSDIALVHSSSRKDTAEMTADFSGIATQYGLRCSDGRTILPGAFDENDGQTVPLVWQHGHDEPTNVLGHAKLSKGDSGVRVEAFFNATAAGQHAKTMVEHGDVKWLSVFANNLVERVTDATTRAKDVIKGNIREVSLVLAGANPGAFIDKVNLAHGGIGEFDDEADEAYITTGIDIEVGGTLAHAANDETVQDILDTLDDKQLNVVNYLVSQALAAAGNNLEHSDTDPAPAAPVPSEPSPVPATADPATEGDPATEAGDPSPEADPAADPAPAEGDDPAADPAPAEGDPAADGDPAPEGGDPDPEAGTADPDAGDAVQHSEDIPGGNSMTHNVFETAQGGSDRPQVTLSHDDVRGIIAEAQNVGSLKKALTNFVTTTGITVGGQLSHGIENIDYLFPDAKLIDSSPAFVSRRMEWVSNVLDSVRKSPFSRIKSVSADITPDEARARGYVKGNLKNEEFFEMSKRETTPQTIYKKQKLDRDDVIDIVDLDVVAWLKAEMKVMLDEELAGAILVGDGRSNGDNDKIFETKIRPVASDAELYVTTVNVNLLDASSSIEELVDATILHRSSYKGSGQPTFYTTEATIGAFLTVKDNFGRRIYQNLLEVASALRVKEVVPVEVMERVPDLIGIMVNLADYTLGADRGGQATMFDDFDIDYNKLLYLIETRCSGALTVPKSALVFRSRAGADVLLAQPTMPSFDPDASTVTVPTVTHVTYHQDTATGTTLTTGSPVTLAEGEDLHVVAVAGSGYYFADNANDEWDFEGVATA